MAPDDIRRWPATEVTLKNGERVTLRPLGLEDGPALAAFYAGVSRQDLRFYYPHPLDREQALANAARAHSPHEVVLVLEDADRRIRGYAWYRWDGPAARQSTFGICLARDCQEVGAGQHLMTRLLEIARTVGPPIMSLTVQLANARALALYRQMGFRVVREQTRLPNPALGFEAEPEYYMEKQVR